MLPELHQVLKDLIYQKGHVNPTEVDVTFEVPSKEWADKLVRPTINMFPFELQENMELRQAQFRTLRTNGHVEMRSMPRRIDVRYIVTAMTTDSDDAFRLLWRVLGVLMRTPELEPHLFPEDLVYEAPIVTEVAQGDSGIKLLDVWSSLSVEPRAAFCYVVTLPVDLEILITSPFALGSTFGFKSMTRGAGGPESSTQIHGVVRDAHGAVLENVTVATVVPPLHAAVTDENGEFHLRAPKSGKLELRLKHTDGRSTTTELDLDVEHTAYELVLSSSRAAAKKPRRR